MTSTRHVFLHFSRYRYTGVVVVTYNLYREPLSSLFPSELVRAPFSPGRTESLTENLTTQDVLKGGLLPMESVRVVKVEKLKVTMMNGPIWRAAAEVGAFRIFLELTTIFI